jgi:hypothetical protein
MPVSPGEPQKVKVIWDDGLHSCIEELVRKDLAGVAQLCGLDVLLDVLMYSSLCNSTPVLGATLTEESKRFS